MMQSVTSPSAPRADMLLQDAPAFFDFHWLGDDIARRNDRIFEGGVMNQAFPVNRHVGGRWFDEMGWDSAELKAECRALSAPVTAMAAGN